MTFPRKYPTPLPAVVEIRDLPEFKARLGLRTVRAHWLPGQPLPTLEVEAIQTKGTEMNDEIRKAHNWIAMMNPLYLDTETTGLGDTAEICQIAIVDDAGKVLFDTLVHPTKFIPAEATQIHGITNDDVAGRATWDLIWPHVREIVRNRFVIIYNASYDARLIVQSGQAVGIDSKLSDWCDYECAMSLYADFHGEWDEQRRSNRWQKLEQACRQMKVEMSGILPHAAAGDCELTRRLIHKLAEFKLESVHA